MKRVGAEIFLRLIVLSNLALQGQLAPTDDGRQLYFTSGMPVTPADPWRGLAVYRFVDGRLELFDEPEPSTPQAFRYDKANPQLSGGGEVVVTTELRTCLLGGGSASSCVLNYPNTSFSTVFADGRPVGLGGVAQVSRNGRFVINSGRWSSARERVEYHGWWDRATGQRVDLGVTPASNSQALTSDGRVLGRSDSGLTLWTATTGSQIIRIAPESVSIIGAIVNDAGTVVVYCAVIRSGDAFVRELRTVDVRTGKETIVAGEFRDLGRFTISNDGTHIVFLGMPFGQDVYQAWLVRADGTGERLLSSYPEGVADAVLAGSDGRSFSLQLGEG